MITYLPLPSFIESAKCLTDRDLEIQRLDVAKLMATLHATEEADSDLEDHPCYHMWEGYEPQLCEYGLVMCDEYDNRMVERGWRKANDGADPVYKKISWHLEMATTEDTTFQKPNWFGDVEFHLSHQAALVRNNSDYLRYFLVDKTLPLIWPVSDRAS